MPGTPSPAVTPADAPTRRTRLLGLVAVTHPAPSLLVAATVAALALVAGADALIVLLLAAGMLGFQLSIGALNDIADAATDRAAQPAKPIPRGAVTVGQAAVLVVASGALGLLVSAGFGALVLALGATGYACGVLYDIAARPRGLGWACFALALPTLLAWTWLAATAALPPGWPLLLPMAALAGPAIHIANGLVDVDADVAAGRASLATQLGPRRARRALALLVVLVYGLAWSVVLFAGRADAVVTLAALVATALAAVGVAGSWRGGRRGREAGWLLLASGLALMAVALLTTTAAS